MEESISQTIVTLEGSGFRARHKRTKQSSLCHWHLLLPPPSPFSQGLLTFVLDSSPVGHRHALPNLLLNRRFLFYSRRSLCSKQALGRGVRWGWTHWAHAHPWVPALCFILSPSSRKRMSGVPHPIPTSLKTFFPLVEHGHKF